MFYSTLLCKKIPRRHVGHKKSYAHYAGGPKQNRSQNLVFDVFISRPHLAAELMKQFKSFWATFGLSSVKQMLPAKVTPSF